MKPSIPFRRGDFIEVTADINAIPAGVYRLVACDTESFLFSVGTRVLIEIGSEAASCFNRLTRSEGEKRYTRFEEFEGRYWELLRRHSAGPSSHIRTGCCFMGGEAEGNVCIH